MNPYLGHKQCNKVNESLGEIETNPELDLMQVIVGEAQKRIFLLKQRALKESMAKNFKKKEKRVIEKDWNSKKTQRSKNKGVKG